MLQQLNNIGDTISHTGELIVAKVFEPCFKMEQEAYKLNNKYENSHLHHLLDTKSNILSCSMLAWWNGELVLVEVQKSDCNSPVYSELAETHEEFSRGYLELEYIKSIDYDDLSQLHDVMSAWALDAHRQYFSAEGIEMKSYLPGKRIVFDTWDSSFHIKKGSITLDCYHRTGKKAIPKIVCRDTHLRVLRQVDCPAIDQALEEFENSGGTCSDLAIDNQQLLASSAKYHAAILAERSRNFQQVSMEVKYHLLAKKNKKAAAITAKTQISAPAEQNQKPAAEPDKSDTSLSPASDSALTF